MAEPSNLIRQFLLGTTGPEEEAQLEELLEKDPQAGVDLLGQVQAAWEGASPSGLSPQQWAEADASVKAMARAEGRQARFRISPRAAAFATALVVLTAGGWFFGARMAGLLKKIRFSRSAVSARPTIPTVQTIPTVRAVPTAQALLTAPPAPEELPVNANPDHIPQRATPPPEEFPTESSHSSASQDQTEPLPAH